MFKFIILVLGAFTLVLWTALTPAQAQIPTNHSVVYTWGYNSVGSGKVCKQVESVVKLDPHYPDKPSLKMHSHVVDNHYCAQI